MFEQALIDPRRQDRSPWAFAASTAGQSLALGAAILISLVQTGTLPSTMFSPMPILAPRAAARPAAPPAVAQSRPASVPFRPTAIFMPTTVPERPAATILDPVDTAAVSGALPYAGPGGGERGLPMTIDSGSFAPPPVARPVEPPPQPKPIAATPVKPVRVSDGVQAAKLIHQVQPLYPALARQVRVSGTVRIEAIIGRDGAIRNLQFVSGHALLAQAAMDAVKQWRYQPTLLSGEPVEVVTQIAVHFTLSQ